MQINELIALYKIELERAERGDVQLFNQTKEEYITDLKRELKNLEALDGRVRKVVG